MEKERQDVVIDKKTESESEGNYQPVSVENFEREMTLVYLMLKGEYSQQKIADNMDKLAITKSMLSPACKVSPVVIQVNQELVKVPVKVMEHFIGGDNKEPLSVSIKRTKVTVPTVSRLSLEAPNIAVDQIIDEKVADVVTVKSSDIQVELTAVECHHVSIPSVSNLRRKINRLSPVTAYKVAGLITTKSADIQVDLKEVEYTKVLVPSVPDIMSLWEKVSDHTVAIKNYR